MRLYGNKREKQVFNVRIGIGIFKNFFHCRFFRDREKIKIKNNL